MWKFLGSTHSQIDEYSRRRTNEISEAVKCSIDKIVHLTQIQQQQLLDDAQKETNKIEEEYKQKLMAYVRKFNIDTKKIFLLIEDILMNLIKIKHQN